MCNLSFLPHFFCTYGYLVFRNKHMLCYVMLCYVIKIVHLSPTYPLCFLCLLNLACSVCPQTSPADSASAILVSKTILHTFCVLYPYIRIVSWVRIPSCSPYLACVCSSYFDYNLFQVSGIPSKNLIFMTIDRPTSNIDTMAIQQQE